jgi:hypothetical protein
MIDDKTLIACLQQLSEDDRYKICDAFKSQCFAWTHNPYRLVYYIPNLNRFEIYEVIPNPRQNPEGLSRAELEGLGWTGRWKFHHPYYLKIVAGRYRNKELANVQVYSPSSDNPHHKRGWRCHTKPTRYRTDIDGRLIAMRRPQGQVFKLNLLHSIKAVR